MLQQEQKQQQQQQRHQPSITEGRLAFVVQPRSVTTPENCAGERALTALLVLLLDIANGVKLCNYKPELVLLLLTT